MMIRMMIRYMILEPIMHIEAFMQFSAKFSYENLALVRTSSKFSYENLAEDLASAKFSYENVAGVLISARDHT